MLHSATQQIGVEAQAVSKHLNVRNFDVELALVGIRKVHRSLTRLVAHQGRQPSPATQVDVDSLEKCFPPVPQQESPVVALAVLEADFLPARVAVFTEGHIPTFGVAPAERVHVDEEHGVQAAVAHLADAHGDPDGHVDEVHPVLVALQGEGHAPAPPGVKEGVQADLVTDECRVDVQAGIHLLEEVLQLQVLEVQIGLEADELLAALGVHILGLTAAPRETVALVAGAAEGDVGQAAHGTAVVAADDARDGPLAQAGAPMADAAPLALQKGPPEAILVAVEQRLDSGEPLLYRPTSDKSIGYKRAFSYHISKYFWGTSMAGLAQDQFLQLNCMPSNQPKG